MTRPIRLLGETSQQLASLKEACEIEGQRLVSLRADELLGLISEITVSPAGMEAEGVGDIDVVASTEGAAEVLAQLQQVKADLAAAQEANAALLDNRSILEPANEALKAQLAELDGKLKRAEESEKKIGDLNVELLAQVKHLEADVAALQTKLDGQVDLAKHAAEEAAANAALLEESRKQVESQNLALIAKVADLEAKLAPFQAALAAAAPKPAQ